MTISHVLSRLAATTVAVAATLAVAPSATAVEADGPHYQEPSVGECRNYTLAEAMKYTNTTPVTHCTSTHTAKVIAVVQLPDGMTWDANLAELSHVVDMKCMPKWEKAVGGPETKRRMSAYTIMLYKPTQAQRDHGARWLRCDVVLWGHDKLTPIPTDTAPLLPSTLPYKVTRCLYGTDYRPTACSGAHNHRATGAFTISGTTYPGDQGIKNIVNRRCPSLVSSRRWMYTAPSRESWRHGSRIVVCYTQTTH